MLPRALILLVAAPALAAEPVVLTDANFEHDTQAATVCFKMCAAAVLLLSSILS